MIKNTVSKTLLPGIKWNCLVCIQNQKGLHSAKTTAQMTCQWKQHHVTYSIPFPLVHQENRLKTYDLNGGQQTLSSNQI